MMPTKGAMPAAEPDMSMESEEPDSPPNLRDQDTTGQNCKNCVHYDLDERTCEKYNTDTKPFQVCDSFSDNPDDAEQPETDEMPTEAAEPQQ